MNSPKFLDRSRYVKVSDLGLGQNPSYTDFEELAFSDTSEVYWYPWLVDKVDKIARGTTPERTQDLKDLIFYNAVHVLYWWSSCDVQITPDMVQLAVETSEHMLTDVLNNEWVMRQSAE